MQDVSLRDTVCGVSSEPSHDFTAVTEKVSIQSRQGTPREGKLGSTVMGKKRVGMLEEGDQYQPVVDPRNFSTTEMVIRNRINTPEVGNKVQGEEVDKAVVPDSVGNPTKPE